MARLHTIGPVLFASCLLAAGCAETPRQPESLPEMPALGKPVALPDDPSRQFDFWLGEWNVLNMHLRGETWRDSGRAVARIQAVAGGNGVFEQWDGVLGSDPLIGFSLRTWDPALQRWVIYLNWHGGKPAGFSKMLGRRNGERIEQFPPDDTGTTRYAFSRVHENSLQWDQALSEDGGATWNTDWIMQFVRRALPFPVDAGNAVIAMPPDAAAQYPDTRRLDFLLGAWQGKAKLRQPDGKWRDGLVLARVSSMLGGFGMIQYLDTTWGDKVFLASGYDAPKQTWVGLRVEAVTPGIAEMDVEISDGTVTFSAETLRETWSGCKAGRCRWERAVLDGGKWRTELTADLKRSEP